jgi:hypothetical protein
MNELMNELSKMPSGSEVCFSHTITTNDFNDMEYLGKDGEDEIRGLTVDITSVEQDVRGVYLYGEMR